MIFIYKIILCHETGRDYGKKYVKQIHRNFRYMYRDTLKHIYF